MHVLYKYFGNVPGLLRVRGGWNVNDCHMTAVIA